jgi:hypothetical protein
MEVIMMKTRSFLLAACIMLALAFTLSCSDDKDEPSLGPLPSGPDAALNGIWQTGGENGFTITFLDDKGKVNVVIPEKGETAYAVMYGDGSNGSLKLEAICDSKGCKDFPPGEEIIGTFTYTLSNEGNTLTISNTKGDENIGKLLKGTWTKVQ